MKLSILSYFKKKRVPKHELIFVIVIAVASIVISTIPNKFTPKESLSEDRSEVEIVSVDNSNINETGLIKSGEQILSIKVLDGTYRGTIQKGFNQVTGRLEFDKIFNVGDRALAVISISPTTNDILYINVVDHYRANYELYLLLLFSLFLIAFSGWTGVKSILSFIFTGVLIWKILLPGFLMGYNPIVLSIVVVLVLSAVIIFLVAGLNKKGVVAFIGAFTGVILTCLLALAFGSLFKVHGAIKPFSENLLYSGFTNLNLTDIFLAGIFISSSGAVMDIAMDIAASQYEVFIQNRDITFRNLVKSGFSVGRAVIGTMTTTLLLAYSGGFTALLMVFIAQQTPTINILNLNYIAGEFLHTMVGSFGLVLVAPITAIIGGYLYTK